MRVASWRDGGEPGQRASQFSPLSPLPAGWHKPMYSRRWLIADQRFRSLRFGFKPIVTIARISSVAQSVKLVGTLPNALRKLLDRCNQFHVLSVLLFHSGVSPSHMRLVLTFACKLVQDKFLRQTAPDMQSHANPKTPEYMPGTAIRIWVVGVRNGS
jgi:hypothetical protein